MRNIVTQIAQKFFPNHCLLCNDCCDNDRICYDCTNTLPFYHSGCAQCGALIEDAQSKDLCGHCLSKPPPFDATTALFHYEKPISSFIMQLKFQGNLVIAQWLAQCWIKAISQRELPQLIIPVPLHHARLKERGFNQALEIAKPIGKYFDILIDTRSCVRIKNTEPQSSLQLKKRRTNLNNAFALSHSINAKHVAILDDVMTTGNTVTEISALLKKSGVEYIEVWCCARANLK